MPRPGEVATPAYERGDSLAYGEASAANDAAEDIRFKPATPEEKFLYSPTDRPAEPITAGAPFGPGPDITKYAVQTGEQLADRVAEQILARGGSKETLAWAKRRLAGE